MKPLGQIWSKIKFFPNNVQGKGLINAFMSIKKELFVPKKFHDLVYSDSDIKISEKFMIEGLL